MTTEEQDKLISNIINQLTEKISSVLLQDFLNLPEETQLNIVLIKSAQLLLANILCQVSASKEELEKITEDQGIEMKELTFNCAFTGFMKKFEIVRH